MLSKRHGAFVLAILMFGGTAFPQLSSRPDLQKRVDAIFADFDQKPSPGCALAVVKDGKIVYQRGYGMANLEHNVPITPDSVFYIGSDSKQFTAFSIALLVEQGKLSLEDRITKYVPELPTAVYGQVTVNQLVHHTSGVREDWTLWKLGGGREEGPFTQSDFLALMARQKALNFKPGDQFMYANSGYVLLGMLVQRVSGKTLAEFAAENIFRPLGMGHTLYNPDHTVPVHNRATGYAFRDGQQKIDFTSIEPTGDGGVMTTVGDLYLWDQNFYHNKLGKGSPELIKLVETQGVTNGGEKLFYAFGLGVFEYKGLRVVGHSGAFAGYKAYMIRFPNQSTSVICLCNSDAHSVAPWDFGKKVADIYLGDQMKSEVENGKPADAAVSGPVKDVAISLSEQQLSTYEGTFREGDGTIWRLSVRDGKLMAIVQGSTFQLIPLSLTHLRAIGAPQPVDLEFPSDNAAKTRVAQLQIGLQPHSTLTSIAVVSVSELSLYVGNYFGEEVDSTYTTYVAHGKLYIKGKHSDSEALEPLAKDEFQMGSDRLNFDRDQSGGIVAFRLDAEGAKNIRFARISSDF